MEPVTTPNPPDKWTKKEKIVYLLDQWDAIFDVNANSATSAGGDLKLALLPPMANHRTIKELSRCLDLLLIASPGDYRHLKAHRCGCEWRIATVPVRRRLPSKKFEIVEERVRQRIIPRWLNMQRVQRAETFLAEKFRGDLEIPSILWDALHLPADSAAWAAYDAERTKRKLDRELAA